MKKIPFHELVQQERFNTKVITYNELTKSPEAAYQKIRVTRTDVQRLLAPYLKQKVSEQLKAVLPLALYLVLFQTLILRQHIIDASMVVGGLVAVILGLMLFMEGLRLGLMPFGETIGNKLPKKSTLPVVLFIVFLLGIGVTFAEPAIGALKTAGSNVDPMIAPYLYTLLTDWSDILVLVVGGGVGLAAVLGTLRFIFDWSLKPLILLSVIPTLLITVYSMQIPGLSRIVGLAWDSGAVTTGPVTVPLVLALGIGIAAAAGSGNQSLSGFGIVTLASLFPIIGVQLLGIYIYETVPLEQILQSVQMAQAASPAWYETTPFVEVISGIRAIVPLVLFLGLVLFLLLKDRIPDVKVVTLGIGFSVLGMVIFNLGLTYGLAALGTQAGSLIPAAFTGIDAIANSPLYWFSLGIAITIVFAFILGFGATIAEPALNALGLTVEKLTNGAFKKQTLMMAVALGVGAGIALGVVKIIFDWSLAWMLLPLYLLALLLTLVSTEEFVNVAWDSAGVTTGPVTVPLVLAMGLGLGQAVGAIEGFGILAMASIGPILCVLIVGLWTRYRSIRLEREAIESAETLNGELLKNVAHPRKAEGEK